MVPAFPAAGYAAEVPEGEPLAGPIPSALPDTLPQEPQPAELQEDGDAVKVVIRVRPPLDRELRGFRTYAPATAVDPSGRAITLSENLRAAANGGVENGIVYNTYRFAFDRVYAPDTPQHAIYEESARGAVANVLQGYNASIIAFGQTGAGKTHTMTGELTGEGRGIIPRAVDDVFAHIQAGTGERCKFLVRASYLQIYNEVISDLLKPEATNLAVREDRRRGVHVDGLSEWVVRSSADVYSLMQRGAAARATGATKLNELSSRSHAIFILIVEQSSLEAEGPAGGGAGGTQGAGLRQSVRVGKLNLVDLAGSERVHLTGATGKRLEESKKINQSLSALGNVIAALTAPRPGRGGTGPRPHVPYRDSKLTRILEDSLGGNCKTTFMAMVSPAVEAFAESLSTLKFAHRAKCVRNAPRVNEDLDHAALLRKYERELRRLRAELAARSKDLVDRRLVLQIDEARRREQADKIAAITALERQSAEIARQKRKMAELQSRIEQMNGQMLVGGQSLADAPAVKNLLHAEQERIRAQYEARLAELEREHAAATDVRAEAEKTKHVLAIQSRLMVRYQEVLDEKEAAIEELKAALEAAEQRAREAEDAADNRMADLIAVRKSMVVMRETGGEMDEEGPPGWRIAASPGRDGSGAAAQLPAVPQGPVEVSVADLGGSSEASDEDGRSLSLAESLAAELPPPEAAERQEEAPVPTTAPAAPAPAAPAAPAPAPASGFTAEEVDVLRFVVESKMAKVVEGLAAALGTEGSGGGGGAAADPGVTRRLAALQTMVGQMSQILRAAGEGQAAAV